MNTKKLIKMRNGRMAMELEEVNKTMSELLFMDLGRSKKKRKSCKVFDPRPLVGLSYLTEKYVIWLYYFICQMPYYKVAKNLRTCHRNKEAGTGP